MLVTIIIDRVGNTNVFNIIKDKSVNNPYLEEAESLQSIIDDDLVQEYLSELNRIANVSKSLSHLPQEDKENQAILFQHLNLNTKLRSIGEAFFRQFFPDTLKEFISNTEEAYLYFHIDPGLASLPLEILHDGSQFLWEKFFLGKSIKGRQASLTPSRPKDNLSMLIIADPTEDLEWARREGEALYEHLSVQFPEKKLSIELLGGRSVSKLSLLNSIANKDIIHYSGHLHYSDSPSENGWVLYDNRIIHSREIQKSGTNPLLIFSNSCLSGREAESSADNSLWYANFAGSFIKTTSTNYIGTNWELPDSQQTLEFTLSFYENLLKGDSIGISLQKARLYARDNFNINDLTWASYLLIGNPSSRVFEADLKIPDITRNILDPEVVQEGYPYPIAHAFSRFVEISETREHEDESPEVVEALIEVYKQTTMFLCSVILSNYRFLDFSNTPPFDKSDVEKTLNSAFSALTAIKNLKISLVIPNITETMFTHKDNLYKLARWKNEYENSPEKIENLSSFEITLQYLLESLLLDIEFLKNYGFYCIVEPGHRQLSLSGKAKHHRIKEILLPTQANLDTHEDLLEKTRDIVGHCVMYNPIKKTFIDLHQYLRMQVDNRENIDQDHFYAVDFVDIHEKDSTEEPAPEQTKKKVPALIIEDNED